MGRKEQKGAGGGGFKGRRREVDRTVSVDSTALRVLGLGVSLASIPRLGRGRTEAREGWLLLIAHRIVYK